MNFQSIHMHNYEKLVADIQSKLNHYNFNVEQISLTVLNICLSSLSHNNTEAFNISLLSVLCWCYQYDEIVVYFNLFYRFLLINNQYEAIDRLEVVFGKRLPVKCPIFDQYLKDIQLLRNIALVIKPDSDLVLNDKKNIFRQIMSDFELSQQLHYNVELDLNISGLITKTIRVICQPDDAMDLLTTVKFTSIELTNNKQDYVNAHQAQYLVKRLMDALEE
eukprot:NODE_27_length_33950_cov_0.349739.p12 type:complete len:220 gc:universal NODE_27_length_33950_cov_0.349739:1539-2198(+)